MSSTRPVPYSTKLFYGVGSVAEGTKNTAFNVFLLFYYNNVLGLPGTLGGTAILLALCVDALTDPLVGAISDDTRTRWGRRHPYMYAAALPMAGCFYLLFNPPAGLGHTGLFLWLTVFAVGVRASMTLYAIPSGAMVPELTDDYDERTTLLSWRFLFGWMGGLGMSVLGYLVFFAPSAAFVDGRLDASAYRGFGATCAVVIFAAILLCSGGTHGLIPTLKPAPARAPFTLRRFLRELRPVLANRSYRMMIFASVFASVAGGFSDVVGLYVNTYFWELSTVQIATLIPGLAIGALLAFAITRPLTERFDKKRATLYMAAFAIFFGPLLIFLRLLGAMPPNGDPILLPLILAHATVLVATVVAIGICVASMIADVVDENELDTGLRQEGMFTSAIAFAAKSASGIGGFAAGVSLDLIRFPKTADPGAVPPEKVAALGLVVGPGLVVFYLVTLVFVSRYRVTSARHELTQAELARRQGIPHNIVSKRCSRDSVACSARGARPRSDGRGAPPPAGQGRGLRVAKGQLSARKGARFAFCIVVAWGALGLPGARPAGAATINLCTDTTGVSPCPLPGTSNPAGDIINVLPGNTADNFVASPGPAYLSPGVIEVRPGATFTNTGWGFLRTTGTGSFGNSGTVVNDAFLQVEDDGRIENRSGASLTTNIDLSIYDDGVLDNDGLIDNFGYIYTLIDPGNDPPGDPDDPTIDNQGTLNNYAFAEILNDGTLNNSGTLNNEVDASISSSGTIDNSGLFVNDGFIDNYVFSAGGGKILNSGDFRVSASGEIARAGTFYPFGTFTQTAGSTAVDGAVRVTTFDVKAGLLTGAGTIQGTVKIGDGTGPTATVDPGGAADDTALLQILGSLTFASDSELIIEIASLADFDRLQVSGASILDGTLTAVLEGGFAPGLGETFTFLTASSVSGGFGSTAFPVFDGRTFALVVDPLGSAALEVVAIPEPATLAMLLSGLALLAGARRRR